MAESRGKILHSFVFNSYLFIIRRQQNETDDCSSVSFTSNSYTESHSTKAICFFV